MDKRYEKLKNGIACVASVTRDRELVVWAKDRDLFVYIGRLNNRYRMPESRWHNPFKGEDAIERFEEYLLANSDLMARIDELRGKLLTCWCYPKPCHGDVLARMVNQ